MNLFRKIFTSQKDLQQIQDNVEVVLNPVLKLPILDGQLISAEILTTGTSIDHKLGRQPLGWIVVDRDVDSRIWRTSWDKRSLVLTSSATVNISLWVF